MNVVNPFDVTRLRTPGAELREALVPVPLVSASVAPTSALSLEGFYQLDWKKTEIDPPGTYFSTNDYVGAGGSRAFFDDDRFASVVTDMGGPPPGSSLSNLIAGGAVNADLAAFAGTNCQATGAGPPPTFAGPDCQPTFDPGFLSVTRGPDRAPGDSGQWGLALRYLAENLNDTEFGFYFVNHHSRLPLVSATYGTRAGFNAGFAAAGAIAVGSTTPTDPTDDSRTFRAITASVTGQVLRGEIPASEAPARISQALSGTAGALAIDRYGKTASYHIEYPEDLQVFGVSFNTLLGGSAGRCKESIPSIRRAVAEDRTSLFTEGLEPLTAELEWGALAARGNNLTPGQRSRLAELSANRPNLQARLGTRLQGYVERDVSQFQVTATKVFGPVARADGGAFITEAAVMHVHDMPDKATMPLDTGGIGAEIATPPPSATGRRRGSTTTTRSARRGSRPTCSSSTTWAAAAPAPAAPLSRTAKW